MQSKMLKKIFVIIVFILTLTGCKAEYEIKIDETGIEDNIYLIAPNEVVKNTKENNLESIYNEINDFERGYDYYERIMEANNENTWYKYNYKFKYNEYDVMSQISKCYDKFKFDYKDEIKIKTSKEFLCLEYYPELSSYKIVIKSDYKLISTNADVIEEGTYTWNINKSNYNNKPITINLSKKVSKNDKNITRLLISFGAILLLIISALFLKKRKKI